MLVFLFLSQQDGGCHYKATFCWNDNTCKSSLHLVSRSDGWCILRIVFVITTPSYSLLLRDFFTGYDSIYPKGNDFFLFFIVNATHISPSGICSGKLVSRFVSTAVNNAKISENCDRGMFLGSLEKNLYFILFYSTV